MIPRKPNARRRVPGKTARSLDRGVWLEAAAEAIAEGGFGEARILTLAKRLGVTRGSFYWHFRDHDDFIRALLERWRNEQLQAMAAWRPGKENAENDLRHAIHLLLTDMARDARALRIELAVQDFARRNALAAATTVEVNRARMKQGLALFEALTADADRARSLTLLLYACITGARLMLAASPRDAKADAIASQLERVIGEAVIAPGARPGHAGAMAR
jgi:AcrR family transcriptional regulator